MLASSAGITESSAVPMITHTAATPQDSPSTTLEPGASFRDFNVALSLERSSMLSSLDSIDRTSVSLHGRSLLSQFVLNLFLWRLLCLHLEHLQKKMLFLVCQHTGSSETSKQLHANSPFGTSSARSGEGASPAVVSRASSPHTRSSAITINFTSTHDANNSEIYAVSIVA